MKRTLYYLSTVWLVLWMQVLSNHFLGGSWVTFNMILVVVLYFGLMRGPLVGQLLGFSWGLMMDASSLGVMGLSTLLFAAAGYLAGMLRRQLDETKVWTQAILSFTVTVFYLILYVTLDRVFSGGTPLMTWQLAVQPFANALLAPLIFWSMHQWAQLWDMDTVVS